MDEVDEEGRGAGKQGELAFVAMHRTHALYDGYALDL